MQQPDNSPLFFLHQSVGVKNTPPPTSAVTQGEVVKTSPMKWQRVY